MTAAQSATKVAAGPGAQAAAVGPRLRLALCDRDRAADGAAGQHRAQITWLCTAVTAASPRSGAAPNGGSARVLGKPRPRWVIAVRRPRPRAHNGGRSLTRAPASRGQARAAGRHARASSTGARSRPNFHGRTAAKRR